MTSSLLDMIAEVLADALDQLGGHLNDDRISEPLREAATALRDATSPVELAAAAPELAPAFQFFTPPAAPSEPTA